MLSLYSTQHMYSISVIKYKEKGIGQAAVEAKTSWYSRYIAQ